MKTRISLLLRGRRPRRAGWFGWRSSQNSTLTLAPAVIGFLRRNVVRTKKIGMRLVQPTGIPPTTNITLAGPVTHPAIRRGKRLASRWITSADVGV